MDIVFLSCVLSVLKHIQMCAALFLYNTRREQKENEKRIFLFFFHLFFFIFQRDTTESLLKGNCVCVWSFELRLLVTADDDVEKAAPARD